ncbi:exopolysaccharide biosynthesis polyprenyl glycosylphosphotransferase [Acidicapsa ligni]|uniref:exopolysaccharide biosynthesis polyprenyl glycosylphosphotransferase n=1 Tax=Acidicapsa ligni TaxID=542300 RepID=UPI0021E0DCF3|nr:exopolysaccharide biosynthesis polyprenyl glycosylphosphotransferase [Acidicapsa ligni]
MSNSTTDARTARIQSRLEAKTARQKMDWTKLEQHLQEVGALHTGVYRLLRDLAPAMVLTGYWFFMHPGLMFVGPAWWYIPRVSLLEVGMICGITFISRAVTGRGRQSHEELIHKEISANLLAAFLCSMVIYPCLLAKMDWQDALRVDAGFFFACGLLSLTFLAIASFIGWVSIDTIIPKREVLIVGSGTGAQATFDEMVDSPVYQVVGVLDDNFVGTGAMRKHYVGGLDLLDTLLKENPVSVVFCSLPVKSMYEPIQQVISVCEQFGVEVRHSSNVFQTKIARLDRNAGANYSILRMVRDDWTRYAKRAIDIVAAGLLLLLTSPILLAAGIAIKMTSKGPILFSQDRYGLYRRRFRIFKLRSMVINAEVLQTQLEGQNELGGPVFKIKEDPRITKVGAFLRKTSIDELPQLWNVLTGEMSLVGPRPLAVRDVLKIEDSAQLRRFSVIPGITCIWQMSGRNNTDFANWIRQDLEYIDKWSLMLDLKILIGTVPAVLWGKGAM